MKGFLFIALLPVVLIAVLLSLWFLFAKMISPLFMLIYEKIRSIISRPRRQTSGNVKTYDLPKEHKGLILFFLVFVTYSVIAGEHGWRGPADTYIMFGIIWSIFLCQIYKVEIIDDRKLIFYRVIKNTEININDVYSLVEGLRYHRLYHKKGTLHLDHFISNLTAFRGTIMSLNPEITTESISLKNFYKDWWGWGTLFQFLIISVVWLIALYLLGSHLARLILNY